MFLKRLEVQGFKSFAGRSVFEFGPGITAIVGPNGSGKSNLADAIRWVLGEQNPRVLRSRKSEEIIFAGGRQRPPAGFAEVSVAFDNAEGWLPIGFDEVVLSRRLHRSGESEYLVNRAKVRLKDVADLLSRAKVGQNSYAIMGQGLVDQVLNLPPVERRGLIEEAADVRRHRIKITDAADRLAATRDNLDRVELLVGEIAPRLLQLESQAHRAAEYRQLTEQLADALHAYYLVQWQERTDALAAARTTYEARMGALLGVQADVDRIEGELATTKDELDQERELAGVGEAELRDTDERMRRADQRQQLLTERDAMGRQRLAELAADIDSLERELGETESGGFEATEVAAAEEEALDASLARRRGELKVAETALDAAVRSLAAADDNLRQARGQAAATDDRIGRAQRGARTLERDRDESAGRRNSLLARLRKFGGDALRLSREDVQLEAELESRTREQSVAKRQAPSAREAAEQAERLAYEASRGLEEARSRLEFLTRLRDQHRNSDGPARVLADADARTGRDNPPRLVALLGEVLRVQKGLERAIEAALDSQLSAVLVPDMSDVQAAVRVLEEARVGRTTIVPLADLKPVHPVNLNSERGVLGVAARFVKCEGRYRDLVDTLLGRVIVVEDMATGQQILRRGLGTVVTLDGVVIRPTGIVTAGTGNAAGLILEFEQELEQLPPRIEALCAAVAQRTQESGRAREQAKAAEARLRDLDGRLESLHARRRRLHDEASTVRGAIAGLHGESTWLRNAASTFGQRASALAAELAGAEEERRRTSQAVRQAQLVVEGFRRDAESARAPVAELRSRVGEAAGARQALDQQRSALATLIERRRTTLDRTRSALESRREEHRTRGAELEAMSVELVGLAAEAHELRERLSASRSRLQPLRERVSLLSGRERELFDLLGQSRTELLAMERASMEAEASVNRRAQAIDRLREEMEADGVEQPEPTVGPDDDARFAAQEGGAALPLEAVAIGRQTPQRGATELQGKVRSLRGRIRQLGPVNAEAEADYLESRERHDFLTSQVADLQLAEAGLQEALEELRTVVRERFRETFHAVNADFGRYFKTFFGGGNARLALTEPEDYGESGVDVLAQPPGKRQQHLQLLSGGERSMTAVALLFALLETNPAPFCVLDEVDAALDEANVNRFGEALAELAGRTQFILVTHNRATVQTAGAIYGISIGGDGISSVLSLKLEDVPSQQ